MWASMVASLGLPLRLTVSPRSRLHLAGRAIGTERPRVAVEHIGVNPLEKFVGFKLALDLRQERLGYRLHHAENGDRNFGIAEHFPNGARESDDGRFVVEPGPQID
jgi:hypothetical protein